MKRYVILWHEVPPGRDRATHWDLMLEDAGVLRTWALTAEPGVGRACDAEQLADHRLAYLDYEGPVSGDRGQVTRWDRGEFSIVEERADRIVAALSGGRISCRATLARQCAHLWRVSFFSAEPTSG